MLERLELASMKRLIPANAKYAPNEKAPHVGLVSVSRVKGDYAAFLRHRQWI